MTRILVRAIRIYLSPIQSLLVFARCFDVSVGPFASFFCFVAAQTKILQCLAQTSAGSSPLRIASRVMLGNRLFRFWPKRVAAT